jgi:predicted enzyme related to lactoylglutathione lyase
MMSAPGLPVRPGIVKAAAIGSPARREANMANPFIWYELMTTDRKAAEAFYGAVVGWEGGEWQGKDGEMPAVPYSLMGPGHHRVAGAMDMPDHLKKAGVPPHWGGYVYAADVAATAERASALGGSVHVPPTDIPGVGRFAVIADPQGAVINVMTPGSPEAPPAPAPGTKGLCGWHELFTTDQAGAFSFYSALFGWEKVRGHDMGAMGVYDILSIDGQELIGTFPKPPMVPQPCWTFYFTVPDIGAAADRVKASGGEMLMGPHQVPGGSWILTGRDPQGAVFALLQPAA